MVNDSVESYYRADIAKTGVQAEKDFSKGTVDAAAGGPVDPAMAQSQAYQRAYYNTTSATRQSEFETSTAQEIEAMINRGATPDEIEEAFKVRGQEFIQSTTDLYDDPDIHQKVAERLVRWTNDREAAANALVKERTDTELIQSTQAEVQNALQRGETVDFEGTVKPLIEAGLDPTKVKTAVVDSTIAYAIETRDSAALYGLLDSRKEGVMPVVSGQPTDEITGEELPSVTNSADVVSPPPAPAAAPVKYVMPVEGPITSALGHRSAPRAGASTEHNGLDIGVPVGTPVASMGPGRVVFAGQRGKNGNLVIVEHADGSRSSYAHLDSINVTTGQAVNGGTVIAKSGNTGNSTGPHLHLTVRDKNGRVVDPRTVVGQDAGSNAPDAPAGNDGSEAAALVAGARNRGGPPKRDRPIGTPSLSPAEQLRVTNAIVQVEGLAERDENRWKEDKKDELILALDPIARSGGDTEPLLRDAAAQGYISPLERDQLARAFRGINDYVEDGDLNEDVYLDYQEKFSATEPNFSAIRSQATRDYEAGRFGTGRKAREAYIDVVTRTSSGQRAARNEAESGTPLTRATQANARQFVTSSLSTVVSNRLGGLAPSTADRRNLVLADQEYEQKIASGIDPMTAADQVIAKWSPMLSPPTQTRPAGNGNTRAPGGAAGTTRSTGGQTVRVDRNGNPIG